VATAFSALHQFAIHARRNGGVRFRVDDRNELAFFHTSRAVFSCWHVDNFYFGGPGPKRFYAENNSESEVRRRRNLLLFRSLSSGFARLPTSAPKLLQRRLARHTEAGGMCAPRALRKIKHNCASLALTPHYYWLSADFRSEQRNCAPTDERCASYCDGRRGS